jgi:hypothetical protein
VLRGFTRYDGTRTPGYPVFLALAGTDKQAWLIQLFLGLITTMLLFYIGWRLTGAPWFGGLIGLAHTHNLGQLFFESDLLTESLTTFMLILTMALVLTWMISKRYRRPWMAALIGLTSTLTLLVRPLFIYLPFYTLVFMGITYSAFSRPEWIEDELLDPDNKNTQSAPRFWRHVLAFLLPVVFLLGGWLGFIHTNYGDWSLTTMTGYHLIQHTGSYFEYVPDEYASLRDTYIKYRDAQIARYGSHTNAIWEAIPEMSQVSGYNFYDLSRVLAKLSIQLILHHPFLYLQNVIQGWWMFWRTAFYWSPEALRLPGLAGVISALILIQRAVLFFINLLFIFGSLYFIIAEIMKLMRRQSYQPRIRFSSPAQYAYFWFITGTIWIASVLQTLLDHGDNPRFLVPLQSLVVLWVGVFFFLVVKNNQRGITAPGQVE